MKHCTTLIALLILLTTACATRRFYPDPGPNDFQPSKQRYDFTVTKDLEYVRHSPPLTGDIYLPSNPEKKKLPGVVVIHGGGWTGRTRADMEDICERLARRGFVAFNVSYRFAPTHRHPAQIEDVREATRWFRAHADQYSLDSERIGAFGYSAGAHLASLLGLEGDECSSSDCKGARVQAVVAGGTPTDLRRYPESPAVKELMGVSIEQNPEAFRDASPIAHVSTGDPPHFLYHGLNDWIVDLSNTELLRDALIAKGVPVETYFMPIVGHIAVFLTNTSSVERGIDFLERYLAPKRDR